MSENIFSKYLTKENMISVINIFQPNLLMNLIENKCQFEQKFIFIYGNREAFPLINN